jgi:hypothetical protein
MKDATGGTFPDFVIAHAVCFPGVDVRPADLDQTIDRALVIDRSDMRDLNAALLRVRDYWRSKRVLKRGNRTNWLPTPAITAIRQHLARDIDLRALLGTSIAIERSTTIRLSEEQANALFVAERTHRLAVTGCAGSGKTLLALLIAQRLAAEGKYVLLLCFNRPLCDHLRTLLDHTEIGQSIRTATFHEVCGELARRLKTYFSVDTAAANLQTIREKLAARPRATWK